MSDETGVTYSLTPLRYLELVRVDGELLADAAARVDLHAAVPTCPGWTVTDAVLHTAEVYLHKIACTRDGVQPSDWPPTMPPEVVADPVPFFRSTLAELLVELGSRDPASPSATWWPPDQTVGFWCRRMAHETAVHRVDVQSAAGAVTPVDGQLALDGIDEILEMMLAGDWSDVTPEEWGQVDPQAGIGRPIDLRAGDRHWRVLLAPDGNEVQGLPGEPVSSGAAAASLSGEPSDLLLWTWGRVPLEALEVVGDLELVAALRDRLTLATQ